MLEKNLDKLNIGRDEEIFTLSDVEGTEKEYRKILEFTNPTNNNIYYIFVEEDKYDSEEVQVFPMIYIEEDSRVRFEPVETDEEFDMISEVLDILYFDSEEGA